MRHNQPLIVLAVFSILWAGNSLYAQNDSLQTDNDSLAITTPFRKGRWITGLNGTISSGSNSLDNSASGVTRNQYAIDFRTGKLVKDRLLVGGVLSFSRSNSDEFLKRTLESLFAGPLTTWYLTDGEQGSLFLSGAAGYVSFRDESALDQSNNPPAILIDGDGFGILVGFGYSYVLHDRVAFGMSLNFENSWLSASVLETPENISRQENFIVADLSFSFGFSVILDKFFF